MIFFVNIQSIDVKLGEKFQVIRTQIGGVIFENVEYSNMGSFFYIYFVFKLH